MLKGFHHAALSTPDLDRCLGFYRDILGCEIVREFGWPVGVPAADAITGLRDSACRAVMLKLNDSYLEVFEFSSPAARPVDPNRPVADHGITHICLEVADLVAEYTRLAAAGMHFHCPHQPQDGGFVTYGRDPDGNVVELLQFGPC